MGTQRSDTYLGDGTRRAFCRAHRPLRPGGVGDIPSLSWLLLTPPRPRGGSPAITRWPKSQQPFSGIVDSALLSWLQSAGWSGASSPGGG